MVKEHPNADMLKAFKPEHSQRIKVGHGPAKGWVVTGWLEDIRHDRSRKHDFNFKWLIQDPKQERSTCLRVIVVLCATPR